MGTSLVKIPSLFKAKYHSFAKRALKFTKLDTTEGSRHNQHERQRKQALSERRREHQLDPGGRS